MALTQTSSSYKPCESFFSNWKKKVDVSAYIIGTSINGDALLQKCSASARSARRLSNTVVSRRSPLFPVLFIPSYIRTKFRRIVRNSSQKFIKCARVALPSQTTDKNYSFKYTQYKEEEKVRRWSCLCAIILWETGDTKSTIVGTRNKSTSPKKIIWSKLSDKEPTENWSVMREL